MSHRDAPAVERSDYVTVQHYTDRSGTERLREHIASTLQRARQRTAAQIGRAHV